MNELTTETILIANNRAARMGNYTENKEYNISTFYNGDSCIIIDNDGLNDHFYNYDVEKFFTIKH